MARRTIPHSFSLHPRASRIVSQLPRSKSAQVSTAIIWFYTKGRMMDTEVTPAIYSELLESNKRANLAVLELEKKLQEVTCTCQIADNEAQKMPQSRGGGGAFSTFFAPFTYK